MRYLLLLFCSFTLAQNGISVEYLSTINKNNSEATEQENYILYNIDNKSIYKPKIANNSDKYVNAPSLEKKWHNKKQKITAYKVSPTNTVYSTDKIIYKDFSENLLYTNRILITTRAIIDESDVDFSWDIVNSKDSINILGYKCQKAFTNFRGRTYVAYFTPQLAINDGPYKFKGLPGLILKIESTDGYYKLEATEVKLASGINEIDNPFSNEKIISLEKFKEIYKETLIKRLKASKSLVKGDENDGPIEIRFDDQLEDIGMGVIRVD
ncbi:GLPGLI family protein [uncultured Winogradskyella sp.]|uniref:GLPGLI family protein n=1 Tax=uncultured Winogradskyella sp. TaxID=395353 RepID=UPI0026348591|nr:GLPGLI family protein [uncultured Winogradskyella sp.]